MNEERMSTIEKILEFDKRQEKMQRYVEQEAELTRLTEKYSRVCEAAGCENGTIYEPSGGERDAEMGHYQCPDCQGTCRIWMMGVDEVDSMMSILDKAHNDAGFNPSRDDPQGLRHESKYSALLRILEGEVKP